MSYIVNLLKKKYLSKIKTTKDLIYKDKILDAHNIHKSYEELTSKGLFWKIPFLKFGKNDLFFYKEIENVSKMHEIFLKLFNKTFDENLEINIKNFLISEIQNSLWIEGIKSSKQKIKQIIKDDYNYQSNDLKIETIAKNYLQALNYVLTTNEINEQNFATLYNILTRDIDLGENKLDGHPYRLNDVQIGRDKIKGINPDQIKESMDSIFDFIKNNEINQKDFEFIHEHLSTSLVIHYLFEIIHPYYDYNGRMGRILSIWYAKKFKIENLVIHFSEAINLFKHELYYDAFSKTIEKNFKFDVTYFVTSVFTALVAHRICFLVMKNIETKTMFKKKVIINKFEKDIIINLLSKEKNMYYKAQDFILGYDEINPATISKSFKKLLEIDVIDVIVSKPNRYKLKWDNHIERLIEEFSN